LPERVLLRRRVVRKRVRQDGQRRRNLGFQQREFRRHVLGRRQLQRCPPVVELGVIVQQFELVVEQFQFELRRRHQYFEFERGLFRVVEFERGLFLVLEFERGPFLLLEFGRQQ
jgi:hypothetical protein